MHSTQVFILTQLADSDGLRYSDMRPSSMDASKFMYHLRALITDGLVAKHDNSYALTGKGKQFIDRFDNDNLAPFSYPRITVALIYQHEQNGTLLVRRKQQPAYGAIGFILRDVPLDYEFPLVRFAQQQFAEATGLDVPFEHRGDGYVRLVNDGTLEGNMLTHVMVARSNTLPDHKDDQVWYDGSDDTGLLSSTQYVLDMVAKMNQHFFFEYETANPTS